MIATFTTAVLNVFDGGYLDEDESFKMVDILFCIGIMFCLPIAVILDILTYPLQFIILNIVLCMIRRMKDARELEIELDAIS
jgi:hydrogenase-4 membrane subunit HyfE